MSLLEPESLTPQQAYAVTRGQLTSVKSSQGSALQLSSAPTPRPLSSTHKDGLDKSLETVAGSSPQPHGSTLTTTPQLNDAQRRSTECFQAPLHYGLQLMSPQDSNVITSPTGSNTPVGLPAFPNQPISQSSTGVNRGQQPTQVCLS